MIKCCRCGIEVEHNDNIVMTLIKIVPYEIEYLDLCPYCAAALRGWIAGGITDGR